MIGWIVGGLIGLVVGVVGTAAYIVHTFVKGFDR